MADNPQPQAEKTMLVAYATVTLLDGSCFGLLPFIDENDVKNKFTELLENWSASGFLLRGSRVYPWHQVKGVEVGYVQEMPEREARQRVLDGERAEFADEQHNFWKTKQPQEKKDDKNGEKKDGEGGA